MRVLCSCSAKKLGGLAIRIKNVAVGIASCSAKKAREANALGSALTANMNMTFAVQMVTAAPTNAPQTDSTLANTLAPMRNHRSRQEATVDHTRRCLWRLETQR